MQAIVTKFLGESNRVKATSQSGSVTVAWDDMLDLEPNHDRAAEALCLKLGWTGQWVRAETPRADGYAYVKLGTPAFEVTK